MLISFLPGAKFVVIYALFLGVKYGLEDLLRVKDLTFCNSVPSLALELCCALGGRYFTMICTTKFSNKHPHANSCVLCAFAFREGFDALPTALHSAQSAGGVLWETLPAYVASYHAWPAWFDTLHWQEKNVKQTNFVLNVALAPWPASKIAQTWLSRLLFTVNKMSEGNWTQFYLTLLDKRNCAPNWGTPLTLRVITVHYLGHSLPLPAMALSPPPGRF